MLMRRRHFLEAAATALAATRRHFLEPPPQRYRARQSATSPQSGIETGHAERFVGSNAARAGCVRRQSYLRHFAFGPHGCGLVRRGAYPPARARRVIRYSPGDGAAAAKLQLHHPRRESRHHAGQEPRARPRNRLHLPDDSQRLARRHSRAEIQSDDSGRGALGTDARPRRRALQHLRLRESPAGPAAHRSRSGQRGGRLGAHRVFPEAGHSRGRGI